jgi:hypothetical protein
MPFVSVNVNFAHGCETVNHFDRVVFELPNPRITVNLAQRREAAKSFLSGLSKVLRPLNGDAVSRIDAKPPSVFESRDNVFAPTFFGVSIV